MNDFNPNKIVPLIVLVTLGLFIFLLARYHLSPPPQPVNTAASRSQFTIVSSDTRAPTPTARPTKTPQVTATPQPTNTPRPTNTRPPTATIDATAIANARATTVAAVTEEAAVEIAYRAEVVDIMDSYYQALVGLAVQSDAAGEEPMLVLNDGWRAETATHLRAINETGGRLNQLKPPEKFRDVHDDLKDAAWHLNLAVMNYADGVEELDAGKFGMARANIVMAQEALQSATDKLMRIAP